MKKIFVLIGAAMTMAVSCQKEAAVAEAEMTESMEFTAGIEDVTKTCLSTERRVFWQAGDEVAVNGTVYAAAPIADNPTLAKLTKVSGAEPTSPFTAVYPASVWDGGKLVMPAVQKYDPDGISNVPMYATGTASFLEFKNIFAVLKVTVPSSTTVKEIRVSSDMVMNGEFSVVADLAVMAKTENIKAADRELVLECGANGVAGTVFHIAIPAGDYSGKHLTVSVVDAKGEEYGMGTNQGVGVYVPRNTVSAVNFRGGYPVYRDGAYFGVPTKIDGLWWAPVQCGYDEELYKYGKLFQWGRYDGGGYRKDGDSKSDAGPVIQTDVLTEEQTTDPRPDATNWYKNGWPNYLHWYKGTDPAPDELWVEGGRGMNDPCPAGWRVPTITELKNLSKNKSAVTTVNGLKGYYLSGSVAYSSSVPSVFFYATGRRNEGNVMENRNVRGYYWSSTRWNSNNRPNYMTFNTNTDLFEYNTSYYCMSVSVRCVHD